MTVYAIGDIHGHLDLLQAAHTLVEDDRAREGATGAPLIHIGDLVDRGPDSRGVIDHLVTQQASDPRLVVLMGNHDRMFAHWIRHGGAPDPSSRTALEYLHPRFGGQTTLASYGVDSGAPGADMVRAAQAAVPETHLAFLEGLPRHVTHDGCVCVHAGLRPGVALSDQDPADLIWIRDEFLTSRADHGALIVHGHTPADRVEHHGNRLNIDTGAAFGGPLSAVVIEGRDVFLLTGAGRVPVPRLDA